MGLSQDSPNISKTLIDLQRFGVLQVTLDRVCNYVNTALFFLPNDVEGLTLGPEKGKKSSSCRVFGLEQFILESMRS